jgi:hypothetical protein
MCQRDDLRILETRIDNGHLSLTYYHVAAMDGSRSFFDFTQDVFDWVEEDSHTEILFCLRCRDGFETYADALGHLELTADEPEPPTPWRFIP